MSEIYLDHAASAPRRAEVSDAMAPFLTGVVGNPSGAHAAARRARRALEDARDQVAALCGVSPGGVTFTGGGTESCHLALWGAANARGDDVGVVTSAIEHHAVLAVAEQLAATHRCAFHRLVDVDDDGVVDLSSLSATLDERCGVVSVMAANNETGVDQPLEQVAALVRRRAPRAVLHTDAIAAAPWRDLRALCASVDLLSVCAHKCGGPVNAGALVATSAVTLAPVTTGGGQERGRRGGTVDVAAAVGLATALALVARDRDDAVARVAARRGVFERRLTAVDDVRVTAATASRLEGHTHVTVAGVASDELVFLLDRDGICVSAGASCSSGATVGSHVLAAMHVDPTRARGAVRFTYGPETTDDELERAAASFARAVARLRESS